MTVYAEAGIAAGPAGPGLRVAGDLTGRQELRGVEGQQAGLFAITQISGMDAASRPPAR